MTSIDYNSDQNTHTTEGSTVALTKILEGRSVCSLLDVGCGPGTWVTASLRAGVPDVVAMDGIAPFATLPPPAIFIQQDLTVVWDLNRIFDLAICLEVAEHLEASSARALVKSLCAHSDCIAFSAAIPGQPGQHHVNCQWPEYWQQLFNQFGFVCDDAIRWQIWNDDRIEPWYRQNIFFATKDASAGSEPRIPPVIHPEIFSQMVNHSSSAVEAAALRRLATGSQPLAWYFALPLRAVISKLRRHFISRR
jgi:hypothetical protein